MSLLANITFKNVAEEFSFHDFGNSLHVKGDRRISTYDAKLNVI
jgi:hypothetical protein